jgi:hypothetical protein
MEKILLGFHGKEPSQWLKVTENPETVTFVHRYAEKNVIILEKQRERRKI